MRVTGKSIQLISVLGSHVKYISRRDAWEMVASQQARLYCKNCGRLGSSEAVRCKNSADGQHDLVAQLRELRKQKPTPVTITEAELEANAGLRGDSLTASNPQVARTMGDPASWEDPDFIERSTTKVREYSSTGGLADVTKILPELPEQQYISFS